MAGRVARGCRAPEVAYKQTTPDDALDLPPGFRFHPTDEEVITHYLTPKVINPRFAPAAITEVDLNKCEPWDMPGRAKIGEKDWYFFCQKDRKYPTGTRTNRATYAGYWKATGKDKEIYKGNGRNLVGMKKTLVFYTGRAPKGSKTNWVMHEFRLEGLFPYSHTNKDEWVVCRVFNKTVGAIINNAAPRSSSPSEAMDSAASFIEDLLENSSPPPPPHSNLASCSYLKCESDDRVEKNDPDHISHFQITTNQPRKGSMGPNATAERLPRPLSQYNAPNHTLSDPLRNSDSSLPGQMCSNFSEEIKLQPHPSFSSGYPSFVTVSRDERGLCSEGGTSTAANKETPSALTDMNDALRYGGEGGYYGYLEVSLVDAISDYDGLWDFESIRSRS